MNIDKILSEVPHKDTDKNTTSKKFKKDILEFFSDEKYRNCNVLELGCNKGYSSRILSYLFKTVVAIDRDVSIAKELHKDRNNIIFIEKNIYQEDLNFDIDFQVIWIDAGHSYQEVKYDLQRIINMYNNSIIIFDDYGHPNVGVNQVIQEFKDEIQILKFIGEDANTLISQKGTVFVDKEGIIIQPKNNKNDIVFMMNIKLNGDGRWSESRSLPYEYSISSWEKWVKKHKNIDMFVLEDLLLPISDMGICWQRYYLFDLLKQNNIKYNQILMVDADTIVHPDTPRFFELSQHNFTVAEFGGSWDWVLRSMDIYSKYIFSDYMFDFYKYFDAGFMICNNFHEILYKSILDLYNNRIDEFKQLESFHVGTDQTPVNFMIHLNNIPLTQLPYEYNMIDMNRKEILTDDLLFTKFGYIYQYNAIPNNKNNEQTLYWMKKTYEYFYGEK